MNKKVKILLPSKINDGRIDTILRLFSIIKESKNIILNWERVIEINAAGYAILAWFFDQIIEQKSKVVHINISKSFKTNPIIENLINIGNYKFAIQKPQIHEFYKENMILKSGETSFYSQFLDDIYLNTNIQLNQNLDFAARLITNELIQNTIDHSTSERYYLYAAIENNIFNIGLLDMGITIPAKLSQKYLCKSDIECIELAYIEGISTRRQRPGGLGLTHTFNYLKKFNGTLTLISRNAQVRRYFKNKKIVKSKLKHTLNGTWCFVKFPINQ